MISRVRLVVVSTLSVCLSVAFSSTASAQTNSLFGNSGPTGQTGSTAQRGGAAGIATGGAPGQTGSALSGGPGAGQLGDLSSTIGQGGFVGRGDNAGRFVGGATAGQQTTRTNRQFRGNTGGGTAGRQNFNTGGNFGGTNRLGGAQSRGVFRPVQRVAFNYRPRRTAIVRSALQVQMRRLAVRSPRFQGLTLTLNDQNQVVLRGTVKTESTKRLVAALAKLEPGVRSVKNEIVVNPGN